MSITSYSMLGYDTLFTLCTKKLKPNLQRYVVAYDSVYSTRCNSGNHEDSDKEPEAEPNHQANLDGRKRA